MIVSKPKAILMTILALAVLGGCQKGKQETTSETPKSNTAPAAAPKQEKKMEFSEPKASQVEAGKKYSAIIKTDKGDIKVDLFADTSPIGVTNFIQLSKGGFYDGLTFHRVVPNFVIQGGDPQGNGTGGPGYTTVAEIGKPHIQGALAWARTGDEVNPERRSSGSQFYITLKPTPFLDGAYSVFGQTTTGMEVVEKIAMGDKIQSIEIIEE